LAGFLAWLRFIATVAMVYCSIASTRFGCSGGSNPATVAVPHSPGWWVHRHLDKVDEVKRRTGKINLLFVGDSITQDYERNEPDLNFLPVWNDFFAPHGALNLGFNGDQTGQMLWRLRHGEANGLSPKDVVILAGANNLNAIGNDKHVQSASQVAAGTMAVVEEVHAMMPTARILVLSILPAGLSAERSAKTAAVNALVQEQVSHLIYARYLDLTGLFMDGTRFRTELYYDEVLHPNPAGQRMMAQAVATALYED